MTTLCCIRPDLRRLASTLALAATALGAVLGLAGCSGDEIAPQETGALAVFGYLYLGDQADSSIVHVTRVASIYEPYDPEAAAVVGAIVSVRLDGESAADTLGMISAGVYAKSGLRVRPGMKYLLRVEVPGEEPVTAETTTPADFSVTGGPPEAPETVAQAALAEEYPIRVACENPRQIFLVDVYCLEDWQDARYVSPFGSHDRPDDYEEYGRDDGEPRHIEAYFRLEDLVEENGFRVIDFYGAMMAFYGRQEVQVLSIDSNYYDFLYRDDPQLHGGISGGIGVFGSARRVRWIVDATE